MADPTQLPLVLPDAPPSSALPALPLATEWRHQRRTWPHALHATCTYLGSLPATVAHDLIARFSRPGDVVLDPFCGRGSVSLQACLERRIGVGIDRSPLAAVLTGAAIDPPSRRDLDTRLAHLRIDWSREHGTWTTEADLAIERARGAEATMGAAATTAAAFFHPTTLAQLLFVRATLDRQDPTDRALLATIAGVLHGRRPTALTDTMPNTFSMSPAYASRWLARRGTPPPHRDLFEIVRRRLVHVRREGVAPTRGIAIEGDAREAGTLAADALRATGRPDRIRLVLTSPPYLGLVRYAHANWLRLWLLGEDPTRLDALLDAPRSVTRSAALVGELLDGLRPHLTDDAVVVLVLGHVTPARGMSGTSLAASAWEAAAEPVGYRLAGVLRDPIDRRRALTRVWGEGSRRAVDADELLVIAPTDLGRRRALAAATVPTDWTRTLGVPEAPARRAMPLPSPAASGILGDHAAADVPPGRSRLDGSAGPHEEPGPRPDDGAPAVVHPPAAGAPVRA
ncbi:MAG: hypothetical protein KF809_10495 [Chloroflexi bacterium]|nr:hypothetical protein [Chloroflexota bacterium]